MAHSEGESKGGYLTLIINILINSQFFHCKKLWGGGSSIFFIKTQLHRKVILFLFSLVLPLSDLKTTELQLAEKPAISAGAPSQPHTYMALFCH